MKKILIILTLVFITNSVLKAEEINWHHWNEGYEKAKAENKPMLVFIYADWCNMCKRMLDKTFTKEEIISSINKNFIAVKFDVEAQDTYKFNGKEYIGNHLAGVLANSGTLSIPTTVFVYAGNNSTYTEVGLLSYEEMEAQLLKYKDKQ